MGMAATADGRVLTCSYDDRVKLWRDGACERTIRAHTVGINAVAVLGARFVSVSEDGPAKLWTFDGALERTFAMGGDKQFCVAALPDGVHFVVGIANGDVRLYHVDGTLVHTFERQQTPGLDILEDSDDQWEWTPDVNGGHYGRVLGVAVTPDGQHIISGADDKFVKVWSVATKSLLSTGSGHTDGVRAVAAMPDGQRILSGSDDKTVRVWLLDGNLENTFSELHTSSVMALVALRDNQHALSGSYDKTIKLFNVDDGAALRTFTHHTGSVYCLALLPDGRRFVSGAGDGIARIVAL